MSSQSPEPADTHPHEISVSRHHCTHCDTPFNTHQTALEHVWDSHRAQIAFPVEYHCQRCETVCGDHDRLETHILETHFPSSPPQRCAVCSETHDDPEVLREHFWSNHIAQTSAFDTQVACPTCNTTTSNTHKLIVTHYWDTHGELSEELFADVDLDCSLAERDDGQCPVCAEVLADERGMIQHLAAKHTPAAPSVYTCRECEAQLDSEQAAITHFKNSHDPAKLTHQQIVQHGCPACSESRPAIEQLQTHFIDAHLNGLATCSKCEKETPNPHPGSIERHTWDVHESPDDHITTKRDTIPLAETVESLYVVNKQAKKYSELGTENYRAGKKATAKANSIQKEALYELKSAVLREIKETAKTIGIHIIENTEYYYFEYDEFSFHAPKPELDVACEEIEFTEELTDFSVGSEKEKSSRSLKASLMFFEKELGLNANDYLSRTHVQYGYQSHFIGWKYLGEHES